MHSDEDLMITVSHGDMDAFTQLVHRYQASVWRVAVRFVGSEADAQDITQSVFLKLFESAQRYQKSALFKTYLFHIVNTTCIDHTRKKRPLPSQTPLDIPDDSPSVSTAMIARERDSLLRQAIHDLPARQRSAIILRYDAELSIRDIAQILGITEKAIERLLAHARETLHHLLKKI